MLDAPTEQNDDNMKRNPDEDDVFRSAYDFKGGVRGKYAHLFTDNYLLASSVPQDWIAISTKISSAAKELCADALTISSGIGNQLSEHLRVFPPGQLNSVSTQVELLSSQITAAALGVNRLVASADSLGTFNTAVTQIVGEPLSLAMYATIPSAVAATTAYLNTASELTSAIHASTHQLATANSWMYALGGQTILESNAANSASIMSTQFDSLGQLARDVGTNISSASELLGTSLAASRITSEAVLIAMNGPVVDYFSEATRGISALSSFGATVYSELAATHIIEPSSFLFAAPVIEPYAQIQATSVLMGLADKDLEIHTNASADDRLDALGEEVENRLAKVDAALAEAYREGISAVRSGTKGWIRHAGVSFRSMFEHLLYVLAPSEALDEYFERPEEHKIDGAYSRAARLAYIFRDIAVGTYAKMAEQDMKLVEATFFPMNALVHEIVTPLSERQMKVFLRRVQGSASVVLEAAGY